MTCRPTLEHRTTATYLACLLKTGHTWDWAMTRLPARTANMLELASRETTALGLIKPKAHIILGGLSTLRLLWKEMGVGTGGTDRQLRWTGGSATWLWWKWRVVKQEIQLFKSISCIIFNIHKSLIMESDWIKFFFVSWWHILQSFLGCWIVFHLKFYSSF